LRNPTNNVLTRVAKGNICSTLLQIVWRTTDSRDLGKLRSHSGQGPFAPRSAPTSLYEDRFLLSSALVVAAGLVGAFRLTVFLITHLNRRIAARDHMIGSIRWSGTEQVLDVGCGNGLVLLAAAKHLADRRGKATGIDIWNQMAGRQSSKALKKNAEIEGVADRTEVQEADARKMPFADNKFDVVFASLSLHHAGGHGGIRQVATEMKRVLTPGGVILIYDLFPATTVAVRVLRELGMKDFQNLSGGLLRVVRAQ
jgi:arsenite methyltransferase